MSRDIRILLDKVLNYTFINESIRINSMDSDFIDIEILDKEDKKIGYLNLESHDGINYTIVDAYINEKERKKGYYRRSIIELLNRYPKITIISVFRSKEADMSWKRLISQLPKDMIVRKKYHPKENTLEYILSKK